MMLITHSEGRLQENCNGVSCRDPRNEIRDETSVGTKMAEQSL